jgi:curved DNA-binding protein CbpA
MARTYYEILELSPSASEDAIRAAYERLSTKYDPLAPENHGKADVRFRHDAIKDAFLTLANPAKRLQYDRSIAVCPDPAFGAVQEYEPFWTMPKLIVVIVAVVALGGWYMQHRQAEARLAAEREVAAARAREAEARAKEEAEKAELARLEAEAERQRARQEQRARSDFERSRRDFDREQRVRESSARLEESRQRYEQSSKERTAQIQRQQAEREQQRRDAMAQDAGRRQAAREREELCRIERERYGKAISC